MLTFLIGGRFLGVDEDKNRCSDKKAFAPVN